jgi:hypothetical protein
MHHISSQNIDTHCSCAYPCRCPVLSSRLWCALKYECNSRCEEHYSSLIRLLAVGWWSIMTRTEGPGQCIVAMLTSVRCSRTDFEESPCREVDHACVG